VIGGSNIAGLREEMSLGKERVRINNNFERLSGIAMAYVSSKGVVKGCVE
jgi:hypothetical protein